MRGLEERYKIARLIAGEVAGTLDEREKEELSWWVSASEENREEYERILHRLARELTEEASSDLSREWASVEKRIAPGRIARRWWYGGVAALVAGVVLVAGLRGGYFGQDDRDSLVVAQSQPISQEIVKSYKALLVLEDGREIVISDTSKGVISASEEIQILTDNNRLQYKEQEETKEKTEIAYNTMKIPWGGEYELILSDGTRVWLNSGSSLTYPVRFTGDTREVSMTGEVCFEVAKRESQPFIVKTGGLSLDVLGTLFNVEAYPGEVVTTTLVNGALRVSDGVTSQVLKPNQQVIVEGGRFHLRTVQAEEYTRWTKGVFDFTETSLEVIMTKLARWYDVEVVYESHDARDARFTLEIKRYDNIANVLSKIEKTGRVRFSVDNKSVFVRE